ncbi:MAG: hypothetical protein RJA61_117 [Candidatus Parcubacteria bacterium]|jgi:TRAP-type mannitol/chloroaromatic compound transport system permease small subunit
MKSYLLFLISTIPSVVSAQGLRELIIDFGDIIDILFLLGPAVAFMVFFWGLAQFIAKSGDVSSHESGLRLMKWGIIALFVILSIMGIISFIRGELDLEKDRDLLPMLQSQ